MMKRYLLSFPFESFDLDRLDFHMSTFNSASYRGFNPGTLWIEGFHWEGAGHPIQVFFQERQQATIAGFRMHGESDFNDIPDGAWAQECELRGGPKDGTKRYIDTSMDSFRLPTLRKDVTISSRGIVDPAFVGVRYLRDLHDASVYNFDGYV